MFIALPACLVACAGLAEASEPGNAPAAPAVAGIAASASCTLSEPFTDHRCWPLPLFDIDESDPAPVTASSAFRDPDFFVSSAARIGMQEQIRRILAPLGKAASMALACAIQYQAVSQQHYILRLDQSDPLAQAQNQSIAGSDLREAMDADRFERLGMRFTIRY